MTIAAISFVVKEIPEKIQINYIYIVHVCEYIILPCISTDTLH
jgi:hypothetical protein